MADQAIALNRFGLGARPDQSLPADPKAWLIQQLGRFEPAPPVIAALPDRAALTGSFRDYRLAQQEQRQARKPDGDASMPRRKRMGAGGEQPPMQPMAMQADAMQAETIPGAVPQGEREPRTPQEMALRESRQQVRSHYVNGVDARLASALATPAPFAERLVHFWSNHFAVSADKLPVVALAADYEFAAIRPNLGKRFVDMAWTAINHPAMLLFLDQAQSIGPDSMFADRAEGRGAKRKLGLNENLAREIMELHTLGVRTGYGQADVTEFARALTGLTVAGFGAGPMQRRLLQSAQPGDSLFVPQLHEPGTRTIMGKSYAQDGQAQARAIVEDLAKHPATARHIATKLARHFVADDPPPSLVAKLEQAFLSSGGDLPTLHRALVEAPESWAPAATKFKSPWDWTVSALRATGIEKLPGKQAAAGMLQQLGQPVWKPGSPAGYDDIAATWRGAGALMTRVELSERLASRVADRIDARALAPKILPGTLNPNTAQAIARADSPGQGLALLLASPEFMRRS